MAHASQHRPEARPQVNLQPIADSTAQYFEGFLLAHKLQLEVLEAQSEIVRRSQAQAAAVANEMWDEWVARWGGGVPLDG